MPTPWARADCYVSDFPVSERVRPDAETQPQHDDDAAVCTVYWQVVLSLKSQALSMSSSALRR
jgi:hypothetical protein